MICLAGEKLQCQPMFYRTNNRIKKRSIYIYGTSNAPLSMTPPNPMQGCFPFRSVLIVGNRFVTAAAAAPPASRSSWARTSWTASPPASRGGNARLGRRSSCSSRRGRPRWRRPRCRCGGRSRRVARSWPAGAASGSLRWMAYRRKRKSEEGEFKPPTY